MKHRTYGTVSHFINAHLFSWAMALSSTPDTSLTPPPIVETGKVIGLLEWAEPVVQESGAKFYMMRVSIIVDWEVTCPFTSDTVQ